MKKFMTSFVALAAGFAAQHAHALPAQQQTPSATQKIEATTAGQTAPSKISLTNKAGDVFGFTLERANNGQLMAYHQSHSSHSSHSSHRSHFSSRY